MPLHIYVTVMWYDQAVVRSLSIMFQTEAGGQDNNRLVGGGQSGQAAAAAALWLIRNELMSQVNRLLSLWTGVEIMKSPVCWCFYNKPEP